MDPILVKPSIPQAVEPATTALPKTDTQVVREAVLSATGIGPGSSYDNKGTVPPTSPTTAPYTTQQTQQILITIIGRFENASVGGGMHSGGQVHLDAHPLVEAILRLQEHGIYLSPDAKGVEYAPPSSRPYLGGTQRGAPQYRAPSAEHWVVTDKSSQSETRSDQSVGAETTSQRESRHESIRDAGRSARTESPAEQRVREVIERAIARYVERAGDILTPVERPTVPTTPERVLATLPGSQPAPPELSPEKTPRPADSIVTPAIREVLNDVRNDTARLMQQLLGQEVSASRPTTAPTATTGIQTAVAPVLNPALSEARTSVNERLTQLRDALQTTIERSSPQPTANHDRTAPLRPGTPQVGDFTRIEPVAHTARPQTTIQSEGRGAPEGLRLLSPQTDATVRPAALGPIRAVGEKMEEVRALPQEKAANLLEALSKAAEKVLSIQTLRSIEQATETAVLTAAAAIALGVMGSEIVLKELIALGEDILARLRGEKKLGDGAEKKIVEIEQLVRELEEECADRGVENINQPAGLVADIPGVVKDDITGLPLEGLEIDGGKLGITYTNSRGEFIFRNAPLQEGFVVVARDVNYSFFPCPAIGTVSPKTFVTILATELPDSTER